MARQTLSKLAKELKPYIVPWIRSAAGGGGGSTGLGGAPSPHALDSAHHLGQLSDGQAPQFLKTDGSRDLTDNLGVWDGVTIDGVDLSVHVANANAHHNRGHSMTSGSDHTASGLTVGQTLRANGATSFGWSKLNHSDLNNVTANQHHNQVHNIVGTDHTVSGNAHQVIGLSASNTLGVLNTAGDVGAGAGGPIANRILRTDSGGALTLFQATVRGGDFEVHGVGGDKLLYVDYSLDAVGIGRQPDPQLLLDVAGPIRGTEIYGTLALELRDVAFLAHFNKSSDEPHILTGELSDVFGLQPSTAESYSFVPVGKFYHSLALGYATTNLVTNPSFETGQTSWSVINTGAGNMAQSNDTIVSLFGDRSAKLTATTVSGSHFYHQFLGTSSGGSYAASAWVKADREMNVGIVIRQDTVPTAVWASETFTIGTEWTQIYCVGTISAGVSAQVSINMQTAGTLWVDGVMVEASTQTSPYFDGSFADQLASTFAWSGTAHASSSTNALGQVAYTLRSEIQGSWSLGFWFYRQPGTPKNSPADLINLRTDDSTTYAQIYLNSSGSLVYGITTASSVDTTVTEAAADIAVGWHYVALTYSGPNQTFTMYIDDGSGGAHDGGAVGSLVKDWSGRRVQSMRINRIGTNSGYGTYYDDIALVKRTWTAERVRAIYESNAQVISQDSVYRLRITPRGLVWADDEGLWVRNVDGDDVFGVYGGEAATKSWGGVSLTSGDILMGSDTDGYLWWDDDDPTNKLKLKNALVEGYDGSNLRYELSTDQGLIFNVSDTAVVETYEDITSVRWLRAANDDLIAQISAFHYTGASGNKRRLLRIAAKPNDDDAFVTGIYLEIEDPDGSGNPFAFIRMQGEDSTHTSSININAAELQIESSTDRIQVISDQELEMTAGTTVGITATNVLTLSGSNASLNAAGRLSLDDGVNFGQDTLSYYDEGTWTPTDASGAALAITNQVGRYTRFGRFVYAEFSVTYPATANGSTATIGGLPFTPSALTSTAAGGGFFMAAGYTAANYFPRVNTSGQITFIKQDGSGALTNANLSSTLVRHGVFYVV